MEQDSEDGMKCKRGEVDDMVSLGTMSDTLFLDNIQARYMQKNIYVSSHLSYFSSITRARSIMIHSLVCS